MIPCQRTVESVCTCAVDSIEIWSGLKTCFNMKKLKCTELLKYLVFCIITNINGTFWFSGINNFFKDIETMLGHKPHVWWRIMWRYVTPALLFVSLPYPLWRIHMLQNHIFNDICHSRTERRSGWALPTKPCFGITVTRIFRHIFLTIISLSVRCCASHWHFPFSTVLTFLLQSLYPFHVLSCRDSVYVILQTKICSVYKGFKSEFFLQAIMIFTWIDYVPSKYGDYHFPMWADMMGWMMTMSSVCAIPIVIVLKICFAEKVGSLWEVKCDDLFSDFWPWPLIWTLWL